MDKELADKVLPHMLTVGKLIEYLKKFNPDAHILTAEMNAFDGGFWQHVPDDMVGQFVRSVGEEKEYTKRCYENDTKTRDRILEKDFIYAKDDNDVIIRF